MSVTQERTFDLIPSEDVRRFQFQRTKMRVKNLENQTIVDNLNFKCGYRSAYCQLLKKELSLSYLPGMIVVFNPKGPKMSIKNFKNETKLYT